MTHPEIDPKIEELMWLEIDETISPSDREVLNAYVVSHADAREHLAQLRQMASLFGQVGEIDPPSELRGRILRALENATAPVAERVGILDRFGAFFTPRPVWRFAVVAAAGIFIGVLGYHLFRQGPGTPGSLDISQLYGTVNVKGVGHNGPALRIDLPGIVGTVAVHRDASRVFSQLDLTSEREVEVVLEYGGSPLGFAGGKPTGHPLNQVAVQDGQVHVRNRGSGTYQFLFTQSDDPASPIVVKVLSPEGSVLYEGKAPVFSAN
jgi:hypothetical protein